MTTAYQVAKLFIELTELEKKLNNEVLPLAAHVGGEELAEMSETMVTLTGQLESWLRNHKLQIILQKQPE